MENLIWNNFGIEVNPDVCNFEHEDHLAERLRECETLLSAASELFKWGTGSQPVQGTVIGWLQDNFYLIQRTTHQVQQALTKGRLRTLPRSEAVPHGDCPRISVLAREVIQKSMGSIGLDEITAVIQAYQQYEPLAMAELWILPDLLRLGILERLSWEMGRWMSGPGKAAWILDDKKELPPGLETAIAGYIQNLQTLETLDWRAFFQNVSQIDPLLQKDPIGIFPIMDPPTQDSYYRAVAELAGVTGQGEILVAEQAICLAQEGLESFQPSQHSRNRLPRQGHVGYYLIAAGRQVLERRLGYQPTRKVRLKRWLWKRADLAYLGTIGFTTLLLLGVVTGYVLAAGESLSQSLLGLCVALIPSLNVALSIVNWLAARLVPPRSLPKMDFRKGIPPEHRTLVAIPALLADTSEVATLLKQVELHYLGNEDPCLSFALLTDFADAPQKHMPDDPGLLEMLAAGITALNEKYGQAGNAPFYLFHRERTWNPQENCWLGWERKRGKLLELNCLLRGLETSYRVQLGELSLLADIRYIITLDIDTKLPHETACRLVAALAHPLNQVVFDENNQEITAGYTVLQPRLAIQPSQANRSLFTQIFSGDTGLDLYARAYFDLYQDLFIEGNFMGKGIYDVDAFVHSLEGRIPDNTLISHDLLEGVLARAGMITDVILFEDYPPNYLSYMRRFHRWVRGDWQLLPWLLPRVPHASQGLVANPLSLLSRWKIFDNLWHSLFAPSVFIFLIAAWLLLPGPAWVWTLAIILAAWISLVLGIVARLVQGSGKYPASSRSASFPGQFLRQLLLLVFLPYETLVILDAIGRTLIRLAITRRHLLQWTPTAQTNQQVGNNLSPVVFWKTMAGTPVLSFGLALVVAYINPAALPIALPFILTWLLSPQIASWLDRPLYSDPCPLPLERLLQLRAVARRTWFYFESFAGQADHWLPPDTVQEESPGRVIQRASPTNIGFALLATLSAYDLGYIGPLELASRLRNTFKTLDELERYRGHFFNWYYTDSLQPLPGRYVSIVDSGNLAGCLLALKQGCQETIYQPVFRWERWQGILDTLDVLTGLHAESGIDLFEVEPRVTNIRQRLLAANQDGSQPVAPFTLLRDPMWPELDQAFEGLMPDHPEGRGGEFRQLLIAWRDRLNGSLDSLEGELDTLLPWLSAFDRPPDVLVQPATPPKLASLWDELTAMLPPDLSLVEIPAACEAGLSTLRQLKNQLEASGVSSQLHSSRAWCASLACKLQSANQASLECKQSLLDISDRAERFFREMDFGFLFDDSRKLFPIGFDVEQGKIDPGYYDLLASEARLASLGAIAKGDVPQSHWLYLGRPTTRVEKGQALLSWNGSLFEYLLPGILLRNYPGTLLYQTAHSAIASHIHFGNLRGIPWGVSESCDCQLNLDLSYRYRPYGIQALSLRQMLSDEMVIAPYASLLALSLRPQAVLENLDHLHKYGMLGPYGLYEAIDFTSAHLPADQNHAIVKAYMSHHQGMILLAITNYLRAETMVNRFHFDPRVESVELILQE